jgi:hypothetical protein
MGSFKIKNTHLAVIAIAILAFGALTAWTFDYNNLDVPSGPGVSPATSGGSITNPVDGVNVNKQLKIVGVDELAGGALDGTTNAVKVYDSDGKTLLETATFSSGSCTTAATYPSGKQLFIFYYYDTTIDSYKFWPLTVPQMAVADAESLTTNQVTLKTREAGAYTDSLISSTGLTIADGAFLNTTGSSNDSMTFTYSFYVTGDNTGYPSFTDTIYNVPLKNMMWVTLSGTGYDTVSLTGFEGSFERASTKYFYKTIADNDMAKYKVGNNYIYPGVGSVSFGFNAAGFGNTTTSYPTMQIYLKTYASADYMLAQGDYGPYDFTAAEQTMLIYDGA